MRSWLAGLRQLVVPWGARHAPRIVIGGDDPIASAIGQDAAIVFYYTDDKAFFIGSDQFADFGTFYIMNAQQAGVISQYFEVTHRISTGITERMDIAQNNVEELTVGLACTTITVGDGPSGTTARLDLGADEIRLGSFGYPDVKLAARKLGFEVAGFNQTPPPATTTVAAAFANIAGATTSTFDKRYDETDVEFFMGIGMFATAGGTVGQYGLNVSGGIGDVLIGQVLLSSPSVENAASAWVKASQLGLSLPAASYTLTPRWKRTAGAGTLTLTASSGTLSHYAREIIEP